MSTQIAVRLPDELLTYLDEIARSEPGSSRAAVIRAALERDRRVRQAERDVRILMETGDYEDFEGLNDYARRNPTPLD
ncbi:MAG: ribbon-helix-helix domain-containing protein [Actinomycetota bacterium]|nr:ribbon-helix-helix domain-containing protein [Actinomycetota bacterium]